MKKAIIFLLVIVAGLVAGYYFAIVRPAAIDIESVKSASVPTSPLVGVIISSMQVETSKTIGSGIAKLAGLYGTSEWKAFRTEKYSDNPEIRCVQVMVNRKLNSGIQNAKFQFLLNRSSKLVELTYFEINGSSENLLKAILALQLGAIDESNKNVNSQTNVSRISQKFTQTEIQYLKKFSWNGVEDRYPDEMYFKILKSRLGNEMGENYNVLQNNISVFSSRVKGDELVIRGNAPHQGGDEAGIIVVNLKDGSTSVGLLHAKKYTVFPNNVGLVPRIVNDWASAKNIGD